jgi:hypothetical protein
MGPGEYGAGGVPSILPQVHYALAGKGSAI